MAYTYEDIQEALEKQVDYESLTSLLETDLNTIAQQIETDPQKIITFEVFFDSGEFNSTIKANAVGEGEGFYITPILLKFVNGDYSTMRGPQFFSTVFSIEVMGYEKDRENLRKIFETYSYLNQGLIDNEEAGIFITKTLEFPFFGEPFILKGETRTQGFMRLFLNYMYNGQMSNEVEVSLDTDDIVVQNLLIQRTRSQKPEQINGTEELVNVYDSQIINITGQMIYDGSDAAKKVLRNIKTLNDGLKDTFTLKITYPNIGDIVEEEFVADEDTYTVAIDNGSISVIEGGVLTMDFVFALVEV